MKTVIRVIEHRDGPWRLASRGGGSSGLTTAGRHSMRDHSNRGTPLFHAVSRTTVLTCLSFLGPWTLTFHLFIGEPAIVEPDQVHQLPMNVRGIEHQEKSVPGDELSEPREHGELDADRGGDDRDENADGY